MSAARVRGRCQWRRDRAPEEGSRSPEKRSLPRRESGGGRAAGVEESQRDVDRQLGERLGRSVRRRECCAPKVREDAPDGLGFRDERNELSAGAAGTAQDIDSEHAGEKVRPRVTALARGAASLARTAVRSRIGNDEIPPRGRGSEDAVVGDEMRPRARNQGDGTLDECERLEGDVRGSVAPRAPESVQDVALPREGQALGRDRRTADAMHATRAVRQDAAREEPAQLLLDEAGQAGSIGILGGAIQEGLEVLGEHAIGDRPLRAHGSSRTCELRWRRPASSFPERRTARQIVASLPRSSVSTRAFLRSP